MAAESEAKSAAEAGFGQTALWLLTAIASLYCVAVLWMPLFPTQDGPMHLYFTQVLGSVLHAPNGFYGHFYFVRHILPPYSLYYYLFMALGSVVPLPTADKLIVCGYIVSFCFGFRYLARGIGAAGDAISLLATALVLNWPLGMGFLNFSLSTTFAFWALGLWCRFTGLPGMQWPRRVGFVGLCCVMMLTHPVPLLLVAGFCGVHLLLLAWRERRVPVRDAATLLAGLLTLGYVLLFSTGHMLRQAHGSAEPPASREWTLMKGYLLLHNLLPFAGRGPSDLLLRAAVYALLLLALGLAVGRWLTERGASQQTLAATLREAATLFAVLLLVGFPLIPEDLNSSAYFAARLLLYVWLAALVAASGALLRNRWVRPAMAVAAVCLTAMVLTMTYRRVLPVARQLAQAEQSEAPLPTVPEHAVGLLLHAPGYTLDHGLTYDPFFWSGVRMLRRTDSVMYNTPWMDLPILPLGARAALPTGRMSPNDLESPPRLRNVMESSAPVREEMLSRVDLLLFSFGEAAASKKPDELLADRTDGWSCRPEGSFAICSRPENAAAVGQRSSKEAPLGAAH